MAEGGSGLYSINADQSEVEQQQSAHFGEREGSDYEFQGLSQFNANEKTKETFRQLTERYEIDTHDNEVINIIITYGSKYAIAVVKDSNQPHEDKFQIIGYSLNSFQEKWCKQIDGVYIKMKAIEQSDDGKTLAICYQDDGVFHVLLMTSDGKFIDDVNVSNLLHLDKKAKPVEGFWEPGIVCSFIPGTGSNPREGTNLMVSVYHRFEKK